MEDWRVLHKLVHLNIQVSAPIALEMTQQDRNVSKNILSSELRHYQPFPFQSNLQQRGKTAKKWTEFKPSPLRNYLLTLSHTHRVMKLSHPGGFRENSLQWCTCVLPVILGNNFLIASSSFDETDTLRNCFSHGPNCIFAGTE